MLKSPIMLISQGRGGGGGILRISSDGDDRIRVKIKTPKKSIGLPAKPPKNSLEQKLTRRKIHVEFPSLKNLQKIWNDITKKLWSYLSAELLGWDKQAGTTANLQIVLNIPKKSLLKSSHPKKYLLNFKQNTGSKI